MAGILTGMDDRDVGDVGTMCGLDGEVVVYTEVGHVFSRCVTAAWLLEVSAGTA